MEREKKKLNYQKYVCNTNSTMYVILIVQKKKNNQNSYGTPP